MTRLREWLRARADVAFLLAVVLGIGGLNLFWAAHDATSTGRKFCAVVEAATARPVPRPADPAANPSRESNYLFYVKFVRLGRDLGCR